MDTETLVFPQIVEPPIIGEVPFTGRIVTMRKEPEPATLKATALASFKPIEQHIATLAARYKDVAYDVTTTKGMADAKAARLALREEGRYAVQRLQERLKDEANDLKRTLTEESTRLIAIVQPVEDAVDSQIKAEETRKAAEREEKLRKEAARIAALDAKLAALSKWIDLCKTPDMTSGRIANGIVMLERTELDPAEWEEYLPRASERKTEVLEIMRELCRQATAREIEAQRLEAQRLENERVAAEQRAEAERLAEQQRQLDEQAAEIERKAAALRAVESVRAMAVTVEKIQACRPEDRAMLATPAGSELIKAATVALTDATGLDPAADASPRGSAMGVGQPAAAGPAAGTEPDYDALEAELVDGPVYASPEPEEVPEDEGGIDLLRECRGLIEHARLAFGGRVPSYPKPGPDWWAALRAGVDRLERAMPKEQKAS